MTGGEIVRIRRGTAFDWVRAAERSMPVPYERIPKHRPAVTHFGRGSRRDHGDAKVLVILLQKRFGRIMGFR